ncbi:MAG: CHAP domain-containing protein [Clostridiales bacterium]|nr:CHAP domain-containing protein [Clostridiales bacterium]
MQKILELAESQVGYLEKATNSSLEHMTANSGRSNYTKYARDYALQGWGNYQAQPWCAMFVSWLFLKVYDKSCDDIMKHFSYCPTGVNQFKARGQWVISAPQAGDIIMFTNGKEAYHVGIVTNADSDRVYTIEGNTSSASGVVANGGGVAKKSYALGYNGILGYGRPNYKNAESEDEIMLKELIEKHGEEKVKGALEYMAKNGAPMIYNYVDDNMPDWAKPTIVKLMDKGYLSGGEAGLGLTDEMLRLLVINDRAGVYGANDK